MLDLLDYKECLSGAIAGTRPYRYLVAYILSVVATLMGIKNALIIIIFMLDIEVMTQK